MTLYTAYLMGVLTGAILVGGTVAILGYRWGAFAALQARAQNSPKWQAYILSLLPPAAFSIAILFDGDLSGLATKTFLVLATPAVFGTCIRFNRRRYSSLNR